MYTHKRSGRTGRSGSLYHSLLAAFSTYSRIPVPIFDWERASIRYSMCFFPLIGVVQGVLLCFLYEGAEYIGCPVFMRAVAMTALPLILNGGIHLDGFMDTADALAAHVRTERRLEILKDPHVGSFAVWQVCIYILWNTAVFMQLRPLHLPWMISIYVVSRICSGLSVVCMKPAARSSMLRVFHDRADRRRTAALLAVMLAAVCIWLLYGSLHMDGMVIPVMACVMIPIAVMGAIYYFVCRRMFGGVTGDLAGWFLQLAELAAATCLVLCTA